MTPSRSVQISKYPVGSRVDRWSPNIKNSSDDRFRDATEQRHTKPSRKSSPERRRTEPCCKPSPERRYMKPGAEKSTRHRSSTTTPHRQPQERERTERSRTPRYRDISDSDSSTISSKSLCSDLRNMLNRLQGYRDTQQNCHRCGSKAHEKGVECPARIKICRFCRCTGHIRAMCPTYSAPGFLREADKHVGDKDDRTGSESDQHRPLMTNLANHKGKTTTPTSPGVQKGITTMPIMIRPASKVWNTGHCRYARPSN